jgi:hypothetical protein
MVEPTETEDKQALNRYAAALHAVVREIEESPATVTTAPHETLIGRIDEARAARQPDLRWRKNDCSCRPARHTAVRPCQHLIGCLAHASIIVARGVVRQLTHRNGSKDVCRA